MISYPKKLKKGQVIGVTAPSDGANLDTVDISEGNIKKRGYDVVETAHVRRSDGIVSTSGKIRAEEFLTLWKNEDVAYILSARGGEFLMEMLPFLDTFQEEIKKSKPKWVQGYSDTSLLLYYLTTNYQIATIHAENLGRLSL